MALSAGWTIDYVLDTLTMSWLKALSAHWREHPPIHKMLAAHAGYKAPAAPSEDHPGEALLYMFPGGRINVRGV